VTRLEQLARERQQLEERLEEVRAAIAVELAALDHPPAPRQRRRPLGPRPVKPAAVCDLARAEARRILRGRR
jgi:hypothetical protein